MRIGVITSGGDCPGLNAAIRAVVLRAADAGVEVIGFEDGFQGLESDRFVRLTADHCRPILGLGGSILGCSGGNPFRDAGKTSTVRHVLESHDVVALVVIGGDSSMKTALQGGSYGIRIVGLPKTIDNDVYGTDFSIGYDTAVNTAADAIDRLRTTAESHDRVMVVETMGRDVGWLAIGAGLAGGADIILAPEEPVVLDDVIRRLRKIHESGRTYSIVVIGEGAIFEGDTDKTGTPTPDGHLRLGGIGARLAQALAERCGYHTRVSALGHIQRGGPPTPTDRILATRLGIRAAELALAGETGRMVAILGGHIVSRPLEEVAGKTKQVDPELLAAARAVQIN